MGYDATLWPSNVVDEGPVRFAERLAEWRTDPGHTDTLIAFAAAAAGHADSYSHRRGTWTCVCGGLDADLVAVVAHVREHGCAELERYGLLPAGSAAVAVALHADDFPGSLDELAAAVGGILG